MIKLTDYLEGLGLLNGYTPLSIFGSMLKEYENVTCTTHFIIEELDGIYFYDSLSDEKDLLRISFISIVKNICEYYEERDKTFNNMVTMDYLLVLIKGLDRVASTLNIEVDELSVTVLVNFMEGHSLLD